MVKGTRAEVAVRVVRTVVVEVEQSVVLVLVIVATAVHARVRCVEVPVIGGTGSAQETPNAEII